MEPTIKFNPDYTGIEDDIRHILSHYDEEGELIFSGRNTLKVFTCSGIEIVVKRFGRLTLFRRLIYSTISHSKARRAYDNGLKFIALGFDTPTPVAYAEFYKRRLLSDSYFISLRSSDRALFHDLVEAKRFDSALADEVASLMSQLHSAGAVHGDPNLNNILYSRDSDGSVRLTLIDTNRSYFRKHLTIKRKLKNLMRVTHRRDLMRHIAGRYAELQGLDPVATADKEFAMLRRFERNRRIRHRIKSIILRRPVD